MQSTGYAMPTWHFAMYTEWQDPYGPIGCGSHAEHAAAFGDFRRGSSVSAMPASHLRRSKALRAAPFASGTLAARDGAGATRWQAAQKGAPAVPHARERLVHGTSGPRVRIVSPRMSALRSRAARLAPSTPTCAARRQITRKAADFPDGFLRKSWSRRIYG